MINNSLVTTNDSISIWLSRMFSVCKNCGQLLNTDNSYVRDDTKSHLHSYCRKCYIKIQQSRNSGVVKPPRQYYYLINNNRKVFFPSKEEKDRYLAERRTLSKFSCIQDHYSSRVGCTEFSGTSETMLCDQCGGLLRYNDHGELECTVCQLISEYPTNEIDRSLSFDKLPYRANYYKDTLKPLENTRDSSWSYESQHWYDDEFNDGSFDVYYSKAYSKKLKKDK